MSILYHPIKVNVVANAFNTLYMGNIAHILEGKKKHAKQVHRLAWFAVHLLDSNKGGVVVMNRDESSLVS